MNITSSLSDHEKMRRKHLRRRNSRFTSFCHLYTSRPHPHGTRCQLFGRTTGLTPALLSAYGCRAMRGRRVAQFPLEVRPRRTQRVTLTALRTPTALSATLTPVPPLARALRKHLVVNSRHRRGKGRRTVRPLVSHQLPPVNLKREPATTTPHGRLHPFRLRQSPSPSARYSLFPPSHTHGSSRSSDEALVMSVERRGCLSSRKAIANRTTGTSDCFSRRLFISR